MTFFVRWTPLPLVLSQLRWSILENFPFAKYWRCLAPLLFVTSAFLCATAEHWSSEKKIISHENHMIAQTTNVIGARCHRNLQNMASIPTSKLWQSFDSLFWYPLSPAWMRMIYEVLFEYICRLASELWRLIVKRLMFKAPFQLCS